MSVEPLQSSARTGQKRKRRLTLTTNPRFRSSVERSGIRGSVSRAYGTDPTKPITSWKVAWIRVRKNAEVDCRFHDLRHTCVTRLLEQKVAFPVVASLMGWSPATTTRMAKRYAHFADSATRQAMETLDLPTSAEQADADRRDTVQ